MQTLRKAFFAQGKRKNITKSPPLKTCSFWKRADKTDNLLNAEQESHPFDISSSWIVLFSLVIKCHSLSSFEIPGIRCGWAVANDPDTPGTWWPPVWVWTCPQWSSVCLWAMLLLGGTCSWWQLQLVALSLQQGLEGSSQGQIRREGPALPIRSHLQHMAWKMSKGNKSWKRKSEVQPCLR